METYHGESDNEECGKDGEHDVFDVLPGLVIGGFLDGGFFCAEDGRVVLFVGFAEFVALGGLRGKDAFDELFDL